MKPIYTTLIALFAFFTISSTALAQEKEDKFFRNEISLNYGVVGAQDISTFFISILDDVFTYPGNEVNTLEGTTGIIGVSYHYLVNRKLSLGMHFNYDRARFNVINAQDQQIGDDFIIEYYGILAQADIYYFNHRQMGIYSGFGVGLLLSSSSSSNSSYSAKHVTHTNFAWHINAIGLRVGNRFAGFAELGFGYEGLLRAGVSVRF